MAELSFTPEELETLRVALLTAHYAADDEERALRRRMTEWDVDDDARARIEHGRAKAALRAMAYHLLAERVLAAQSGASGAGEAGERTS